MNLNVLNIFNREKIKEIDFSNIDNIELQFHDIVLICSNKTKYYFFKLCHYVYS